MICRLWHGWTAAGDADAYERYLKEELYPRLERELGGKGYLGHHVLRRLDGDEVEFVTMTWFDSHETVCRFAGDDYETPVITERARALLSRYEDRAVHYDLAALAP
jgi:heme-degrading monooxygenase HmoA